MDGYTAWKLHRAVNLHLTSLKYDIFEYQGRARNTGPEVYQRTNSKSMFEAIGRKFDKPYSAVEFFISNIIYSQKDEVFDQIKSWENHKLYLKHKESLTKFIMDDIELLDLSRDIRNPNALPELLKGIIAGKYLPQTAVALDKELNFLDEWTRSKIYFGFKSYPIKIMKLKRFVKYNEEKVKSLIDEKLYETI